MKFERKIIESVCTRCGCMCLRDSVFVSFAVQNLRVSLLFIIMEDDKECDNNHDFVCMQRLTKIFRPIRLFVNPLRKISYVYIDVTRQVQQKKKFWQKGGNISFEFQLYVQFDWFPLPFCFRAKNSTGAYIWFLWKSFPDFFFKIFQRRWQNFWSNVILLS